jgi:hypothetical protein
MPQQRNPALLGLQRAFARDVPEGYEGQSAWQADLGGVQDQDLMRVYRQRQQDRIDAENRAAGPFTPMVRNSFNLPGFFEGVQHSDQAAGIGPQGDVIAKPKNVTMVAPRGSSYAQGSRRLRAGSIDNNQAYSLMGLARQLRETT